VVSGGVGMIECIRCDRPIAIVEGKGVCKCGVKVATSVLKEVSSEEKEELRPKETT